MFIVIQSNHETRRGEVVEGGGGGGGGVVLEIVTVRCCRYLTRHVFISALLPVMNEFTSCAL